MYHGMKARTIRHILTAKFEEFAKSIDDPHVQEVVRKNTII